MKNSSLQTLGVPPNAWAVDETTADITRPSLPPKPVAIKTETKTLQLDLAKTAILVIDMQNDFLPGGALAVRRRHLESRSGRAATATAFAPRSVFPMRAAMWRCHPEGGFSRPGPGATCV